MRGRVAAKPAIAARAKPARRPITDEDDGMDSVSTDYAAMKSVAGACRTYLDVHLAGPRIDRRYRVTGRSIPGFCAATSRDESDVSVTAAAAAAAVCVLAQGEHS
jgi:hypothetical protein